MSNAKRIYAELLKTASDSREAKRAVCRALGKEAALDPALLRRLGLAAGGLGLLGGGVAAGRYLFPRSPSEAEALESIGITEPGEYSVGVSPDVFGQAAEEPEPEEEEGPDYGLAPYYGRLY